MNVHVIIDFMHIYYKYYFQLKAGKLKRLSAGIDWNGTVIEKDTTLIYYPLRDIEGIRKELEGLSHNVTVSVCFDTPSLRKEINTDSSKNYKSGRKNSLTDEDFKNIDFIKRLLDKAGHNIYKIEGYEADDIINHLTKKYNDKFDYTIVYTNDKDLLINVSDNVGVMRFKQYKGYTQVDKSNYSSYLEEEYGVYIPYNAIGLYLATVGDTADKIKGINKFGPKSFSKLMNKVSSKYEIDWNSCSSTDGLYEVLNKMHEFLTEEQYKQAYESLSLVVRLELNGDINIEEPIKHSTKELRESAYMEYKMVSLCL